jgi:hypothetical protein
VKKASADEKWQSGEVAEWRYVIPDVTASQSARKQLPSSMRDDVGGDAGDVAAE